jgi:hypothetical protein
MQVKRYLSQEIKKGVNWWFTLRFKSIYIFFIEEFPTHNSIGVLDYRWREIIRNSIQEELGLNGLYCLRNLLSATSFKLG